MGLLLILLKLERRVGILRIDTKKFAINFLCLFVLAINVTLLIFHLEDVAHFLDEDATSLNFIIEIVCCIAILIVNK